MFEGGTSLTKGAGSGSNTRLCLPDSSRSSFSKPGRAGCATSGAVPQPFPRPGGPALPSGSAPSGARPDPAPGHPAGARRRLRHRGHGSRTTGIAVQERWQRPFRFRLQRVRPIRVRSTWHRPRANGWRAVPRGHRGQGRGRSGRLDLLRDVKFRRRLSRRDGDRWRRVRARAKLARRSAGRAPHCALLGFALHRSEEDKVRSSQLSALS